MKNEESPNADELEAAIVQAVEDRENNCGNSRELVPYSMRKHDWGARARTSAGSVAKNNRN